MHKTRYYRLIKTGKTDSYERNGKKVNRPVLDKIYIEDSDFENISLETGDLLPDLQGHKTIIPNYFFDFWTPILGVAVAFTYIRYVRMAYGESDITYSINKMAQMMNIAPKTLRSHLDTLEEYGFICRFYRDTISEDGTVENGSTETTIKVRKTIPLVPKSLLEKLPSVIQIEHEKYLKNVLKTASLKESNDLKSANEVLGIKEERIENIKPNPSTKSTTPPNTKSTYPLVQNVLPSWKESYYPPSTKCTTDQEQLIQEQQYINLIINNIWNEILKNLKEELNPLSFETWLDPLEIEFDSGCLILICSDTFRAEWIKEKYLQKITELGKKLSPYIEKVDVKIKSDSSS